MIKINLSDIEKKILCIAYLNYFSNNCREHKDLVCLRKLETKSLADLDKLIQGKKLEKLSKKYDEIKVEKKKGGKEGAYFRLYGYPMANSTDSMDVEKVKKLLLIDIEEITSMPSADSEVKEIQFFYSLQWLMQIMKKKSNNEKLDEIELWYKNCSSTLEYFLNNKKTKKGHILKINKLFDVKRFEDEVIKNKKITYLNELYKKYKDILSELNQFFDLVFAYKEYFENKRFKYILASLMKVNVCPYCNRQYISVLHEKKRTSLTFDHYKREATFPLLKLTLYNLIPACYICNSLFKNTSDLEHLYPWKEGSEGIRFTYDKTSVEGGNLKAYYKMNNCDNIQETKIDIDVSCCSKRAENSIALFNLKEIYQVHNHYASVLIAKAMKYEQGGYKTDVFKVLEKNKILSNEDYLDDFLYGMNFQKGTVDEMGKDIPLFKLCSDIVGEIKK